MNTYLAAMNPYLAVMSARFRTLLQYRAAALAGLATQLFWGLLRVMIFAAFFEAGTAPQPLSLSEVVTYIWLGQSLIRLLPFGPDGEIRTKIQSGNIVYELLKPMDLYLHWYVRSLANLTAPTLLRAIPLVLVAGCVLGLTAPRDGWALAGFACAVGGAVLIAAALQTLLSISLLRTLSGDGLCQMTGVLVWTLSGMIVPLAFYPGWLRAMAGWLPFRGVMDSPFRIYLGRVEPQQIPAELAFQLGWALALIVAGRLLLRRGMRRLVVQGG